MTIRYMLLLMYITIIIPNVSAAVCLIDGPVSLILARDTSAPSNSGNLLEDCCCNHDKCCCTYTTTQKWLTTNRRWRKLTSRCPVKNVINMSIQFVCWLPVSTTLSHVVDSCSNNAWFGRCGIPQACRPLQAADNKSLPYSWVFYSKRIV